MTTMIEMHAFANKARLALSLSHTHKGESKERTKKERECAKLCEGARAIAQKPPFDFFYHTRKVHNADFLTPN